MRKIILFMVLSLDGAVSGPNDELDWENRDPEVGAYLIPELLKTVDTMVLGRVLYEGFAQAWPAIAKDATMPKDLVDFANWVIDAPKLVFSNTLKEASWNNSRVLSPTNDTELTAEVQKLKAQEGGDIVLFGGVRLAQTFVRLGLVDEYRFKLQTVALGNGKPLFLRRTDLTLRESKQFDSGVVALHYEPKR